MTPKLKVFVPAQFHGAGAEQFVRITDMGSEEVACVSWDHSGQEGVLALSATTRHGASPLLLVPPLWSRIPNTPLRPNSYAIEDVRLNKVAGGEVFGCGWRMEDVKHGVLGILRLRWTSRLGFRVFTPGGLPLAELKALPQKEAQGSPVHPFIYEGADSDFCTWVALMIWLSDLVHGDSQPGTG